MKKQTIASALSLDRHPCAASALAVPTIDDLVETLNHNDSFTLSMNESRDLLIVSPVTQPVEPKQHVMVYAQILARSIRSKSLPIYMFTLAFGCAITNGLFSIEAITIEANGTKYTASGDDMKDKAVVIPCGHDGMRMINAIVSSTEPVKVRISNAQGSDIIFHMNDEQIDAIAAMFALFTENNLESDEALIWADAATRIEIDS